MTHTHYDGIILVDRVNLTKKHYIEVFFWKTHEQVYKALNYGDDYQALAISNTYVRHGGRSFVPRKIGELHLVDTLFSAGVLAHEMQHIINHYITVRKLDPSTHDERIASLAGRLHRQFWKMFYSHFESSE